MNLVFVAILLALMAMAYRVGTGRLRSVTGAGTIRSHSRAPYYGVMIALWCAALALGTLLVLSLFEPLIARYFVTAQLPPEARNLPDAAIAEMMRRIAQIAAGAGIADAAPYENLAAARLRTLSAIWWMASIALFAAAGIVGIVLARRRIRPDLRARDEVERALSLLLILCSGVAILTTLGIIASLLGEALRFFTFVSPLDFFFGTVWNPAFSTTGSGNSGDFGLLPLLAGTLMISAIAMLVALPVGLMTAIYMAEYASPAVRNIAKPIIEVLAGIPTIVYGVFALTVAGPTFAATGALFGLDIRATSAFTAGVVMGVMIIPFISSLSDDIITQVPRAMRDGSLGLGATRSETIKRVVLPAALPGIVGAFLLAVSRAIGETMIVVLAAGNSPVLRANPFEPSTTVTVSIINQLTGDSDFASPQSLVAFALGLTLFVMTLGLNVVALYIVRRYREQYE